MRHRALLTLLILPVLLLVSGCGSERNNESASAQAGTAASRPNQIILPNSATKQARKQAKNTDLQNLFAEDIRDIDQRFDRIEGAVVDLKRDFETLKPTIMRLDGVADDLEELTIRLETLLRAESTQRPAYSPPAPAAQPIVSSPPPAPRQESVAVGGPTAVQDIRFGRHSDKIRVVMDLNGESAYTIDLDNAEHILVVELAQAGWKAGNQNTGGAPVIKSYNTEALSSGNGSRIVFVLSKDTRILEKGALKPGNTPYHRIFFDLAL